MYLIPMGISLIRDMSGVDAIYFIYCARPSCQTEFSVHDWKKTMIIFFFYAGSGLYRRGLNVDLCT